MKLNYFNFKKFQDQILITNDFGCDMFVSEDIFKRILKKDIDLDSEIGQKLLEKNIIGGFDLSAVYEGMDNHMLICVTEIHSKEDIDSFADAVAEIIG